MIPKVIHYCWFGGAPKSELTEKCIASWKKYCPDYEIIEWNESNYDVTKQPFMKAAYERKKWAFVSDYARIDTLYQRGGVYLDTDVELISGLDALLQYDFFAGFENATTVAFGLGFGSVAGHPVLREIMDRYDATPFPEHESELRLVSCPLIQTEALKAHGLVCDGRDQVVDGCHIFSPEVLCPKSYETGKTVITDRTISIHHYDMSWVASGYKNAKKNDWRLARIFGERWGKRISRAVSFPSKLATHVKDGTLGDYLRLLTGKNEIRN